MSLLLAIPIVISLILTILVLPKWIKKCKQTGMLWEDMNKAKHPRNVAASGGIVVIMAFILSVLSYIAIITFLGMINGQDIVKILSLLSVILILALVGLTDDLLGWKRGGLSWKLRLVLAFMASIPLVVINAGEHVVGIPFFGITDLGLLYTLFLIPLGVAGATTTYNMLAGFNGLEAGQGVIILSFLSFISYLTGNTWLAIIGLCMAASVLAFYFYNKVPAKVFPGDIMTWSIGALIACMAILGNFEKIAVFVFIPYIIETFLKVRGKLKKQSFGIPDKNNNLSMPYNKIYSLTHLAIFILSKFKKNVKESDVVYLIFAFEILLCLSALIIFRNYLFI